MQHLLVPEVEQAQCNVLLPVPLPKKKKKGKKSDPPPKKNLTKKALAYNNEAHETDQSPTKTKEKHKLK